MNVALGIYLYVAVCAGLIAWRTKDDKHKPQSRRGVVVGSIFLGLIWPISLPAHAIFDHEDRP